MKTWQIRNLRKKMKLTTREFAARFGVSHRTVENWECGRRIPGGPAIKILQGMMEAIKK